MTVRTLRVRKVKTTTNSIGTVKTTIRCGLCPKQASMCVETVLDAELGTCENVLMFPMAVSRLVILIARCL